MVKRSSSVVFSTLAACAAVAAVAFEAPGAWAAGACWACMGAASALWNQAASAGARAKDLSEAASQAYAQEGYVEEGKPGARRDIKQGAVMATSALVLGLASAMAWIGAMSLGALWGALAAGPILIIGARAAAGEIKKERT